MQQKYNNFTICRNFVVWQNHYPCFIENSVMNRLKNFFIVFFLLFSVSVFPQTPLHHRLQVTLNPSQNHLRATDTIDFPASFLQKHDSILFYLNPHLQVEVVSPGFSLVKTVKQDKKSSALRYALIPEGTKTATVVLSYAGRINDSLTSGAAEYARGFRETTGIISNNGVYLAGSTFWMPVWDTPLFTYSLTTRLPVGWTVVSQGVRTQNDTAGGMRSVRYDCRFPQDQAYLTAYRWTEYDAKAGRVALQAFLRTPDKKLAFRYLNMTGVYLNMYVRLLGPYPYSKFALVENFWETGYGMPSFTLLGSKIIRFPFILYSSYPHELLHNWWGNSVYVDMPEGNWCEGLTAYMADHMLKEQRGQGAEYRRNTLQKFTDFVNVQNDFPVVDFRERHNAAEEAIGYGKSLMFQHMLRQMVGDSLYIRAYRRFYEDYRFKIASFDDIRTTFEKVTGRNLKPFFDEWLTRKGAPHLTLSEVKIMRQKKNFLLSFQLSQIQPEAVFPLTIPVAVYFADTVMIKKVYMRHRVMYPLFTFQKQPLRIEVDPQFDVMRRLDKGESAPSLTQLFGNVKGTLVLPARDSLLPEYKLLAETWKQTAEVQHKNLRIVFDNEIKTLPKEGPVWIVGFHNRFAGLFDVEKTYGRYFTGKQRGQISELRRTGALVFAIPHPDRPIQTIGFVGANIAASVNGLARLLPHYGKYSWLGFKGSRPDNILKGTFPPLHSPLHYNIPVKGVRPVITARLKPEPPLIEMQ
jgi:aminopeptidase N